jgi:hypothetical protein
MSAMSNTAALRFRSWERFQHYRDRKPPWIKLHRELLDDPDYAAMSATAAKYLPLAWLVASERGGVLPDITTLAFRLRISTREAAQCVTAWKPYLCDGCTQGASKALATCKQDATLETETETETEREGEGDAAANAPPNTPPSAPVKKRYGEFEGVKLTDDEHAKLLAKHGKERLEQGISILDDYMRSKGKRYKDHYAALKETSWVWERVDQQRAAAGLSVPANRQPAVAVPAYILRERAERERAAAGKTEPTQEQP